MVHQNNVFPKGMSIILKIVLTARKKKFFSQREVHHVGSESSSSLDLLFNEYEVNQLKLQNAKILRIDFSYYSTYHSLNIYLYSISFRGVTAKKTAKK